MTKEQNETVERIRRGDRIIVFFAVAQPLADSWSAIIKEQDALLVEALFAFREFGIMPGLTERIAAVVEKPVLTDALLADPALAREGGVR